MSTTYPTRPRRTQTAAPAPPRPRSVGGGGVTAITAEHELLTVAEAADRLRVTGRFIRMLIADGTLPALRLGKRAIRLRTEDVDRVLRPVQAWSDGPR